MDNQNDLNYRSGHLNEEDYEPDYQQPVQRERRSGLGQNRNRTDQLIDNSIEDVLVKLEETLHAARKVPLSDQCMVDREEILFLLDLLREQLPEELRQAKWLLQQNRQLIAEARKEAESILHDAEIKMSRMIDEHEITQQAKIEAQRIVDDANTQSRQIQTSTMDYVRNNLDDLEDQLTEMLVYIQKNKKDLDF
ncbi:MAG: ATP synthase F0 subunit B [Clostridiaceae bacterium]|mgnify:CR=1 FL=1|jgi:vacuolar-type H+-ATPase subunit H|nr:ATP synthase F0 subunit B [Bacillota bacterium]NLN52325.1 ATP synthase F0 subunit B [Clostridiaceae bacterium]